MLLSIFTLGILLGPRSENPEFLSRHRDRLGASGQGLGMVACGPNKVRPLSKVLRRTTSACNPKSLGELR